MDGWSLNRTGGGETVTMRPFLLLLLTWLGWGQRQWWQYSVIPEMYNLLGIEAMYFGRRALDAATLIALMKLPWSSNKQNIRYKNYIDFSGLADPYAKLIFFFMSWSKRLEAYFFSSTFQAIAEKFLIFIQET